MAAPWVVQVTRLALGRHVASRLPCTCGVQYQRVQHNKGTKRFAQPPVGKENAPWLRRVAASAKPKKITKKMLAMQERVPTDDVWMRAVYPRPVYSFAQCVAMHREYASPDMTDNMNAFIQLDLTLNMTTKKKTKFMSDFTQTLVLPHYFDDGTINRILAFCKTPEDRQKAEEMGAAFVGGLDLIKMLQKGEVHQEEYEHVICSLDMLVDVASVRKHLRDLFPNKNKGSLGTDIEEMMTQFSQGKTFATKKIDDASAELTLIIGTLDMEPSQLEENYIHYVTAICAHRPVSLGPFITNASARCLPSYEAFKLTAQELLPPSQRSSPTEPQQSDDEGREEAGEEEMVARQ